MALESCPECGREISSEAIACPGCGFPPSAQKPPRWHWALSLSVILFALVFGWHWFVLESWRQERGTRWSYNPLTNVITLPSPSSSPSRENAGVMLGEALGRLALPTVGEAALEAKAREWCDIYGMIFGYRIHFE